MKLTKGKLIKALGSEMENLGYQWFKDSISGAQGLFAKKVNDSLYLTVGLTIHRYYEDAFTADLYLSKTTNIYCTWGDIPKDCIERPGFLMTNEELAKYREGNNLIKDIWWSCDNSLDDFLYAIHLTAPRMYDNGDLIRRIRNSKEVANLWNISSKIKKSVSNIPDTGYSFIPEKEIDGIPLDWFKATEWTLREAGENINFKIVNFHASDAYRQYVLDSQYAHNHGDRLIENSFGEQSITGTDSD